MTGDPLTDEVAEMIAGFTYSGGINGHVIAAMAVLGHPTIADGVAALPVLARLRAQHQPRRWSADSDAKSCTCGASGCTVAETLDADR